MKKSGLWPEYLNKKDIFAPEYRPGVIGERTGWLLARCFPKVEMETGYSYENKFDDFIPFVCVFVGATGSGATGGRPFFPGGESGGRTWAGSTAGGRVVDEPGYTGRLGGSDGYPPGEYVFCSRNVVRMGAALPGLRIGRSGQLAVYRPGFCNETRMDEGVFLGARTVCVAG
jgi:hypothetical protein